MIKKSALMAMVEQEKACIAKRIGEHAFILLMRYYAIKKIKKWKNNNIYKRVIENCMAKIVKISLKKVLTSLIK
jgi:hypothetical protein